MTGITSVLAGSSPNGGAPLSVTASSVFGFDPSLSFVTVTSNTPGAVVSGGGGPYTYYWTYLGGDADPVPSSAATLNPTWSATLQNNFVGATWRLTVTDSIGSTPATEDIYVTLSAGFY